MDKIADLGRKTELVANVAIILVALLLGSILIKTYLSPVAVPRTQDPRLTPGTRMLLSGIDWQSNFRTVLLVLSEHCEICSQSAPSYRQFVEKTDGRKDLQIVAVLPQEPSESRRYLDSLGISVNGLAQSALSSIGVKATPSLILVDNNGFVIDSWVGKMTESKISEVLNKLDGR